MLVGLGGYRSFLFVIAVTWWAVQGWGWARWILNTEARTERATLAADGGLAWLVKNLPRILGICAFGVASFAAWTSDQTLIAVILVLIGIVTYYFFVRRLAWSELPRLNWLDSDTVPQRITWVLLLLAAICGTFIPVRMGEWLGAGAIAFFGLGCLIPAGTWIVHLGRTRRLPALTILIIVAIVFSYFNDNHRIRTLSSEPGVPVPGLTLKDALDQWYSQAPKNINGADNDPVPMVLVAAAGGGLRATFWTTSVLGKLERGTADFHQHIFAISGISGGALGGVLYASALSQLPQDAEPEVRRSFADKLARASGQDYLGPVVAALLFPDLIQRFLPVGFLPDRAKAIEQGWERGYQRVFGDVSCGLDTGFRHLWSTTCRQEAWLPLVLNNGTHEESGRRVITSPLAMEQDEFQDIFPNSLDFFRRHDNEAIAQSTAAHNAARFTYISPAGTLGPDGENGHVLDGGYFENFGATTLHDLLRKIMLIAEEEGMKIRPIVIQLSNDTSLARSILTGKSPDELKSSFGMNETLAPIRGLLSTRTARGVLAVRQLDNYVRSVDGQFYLFHLEKNEHVYLPLGWVLSPASQLEMLDQVCRDSNVENNAAFNKILQAVTDASNVQCPGN